LDLHHLCFLTAAVSNSSTPTPSGSAQQGQPPVAPPPAQYSYQEINVASLAGLAPHIQINAQVGEVFTAVNWVAGVAYVKPRRCLDRYRQYPQKGYQMFITSFVALNLLCHCISCKGFFSDVRRTNPL